MCIYIYIYIYYIYIYIQYYVKYIYEIERSKNSQISTPSKLLMATSSP